MVLLVRLAHALVLALPHLRVVLVLAAVSVLLADLGPVSLVVAVHLLPPPCRWPWVAQLVAVELAVAHLCTVLVLPCCLPTLCLPLHLVPLPPLWVSRHLAGVQVVLRPQLPSLVACRLAVWRRTCVI